MALVRDSTRDCCLFREGLVDRIITVRGSLSDHSMLRRAISEYETGTVFHLAAQTQVGVAKRDPLNTLEANVRGTWNVLEACRQAEIKQVVVASSDKAYGSPSELLPYLETHPLQGRYPYDCSKSCTDLLSTMYATSYGVPVAIARFANIFGGGDANSSRIIPNVIRATLRGERFVIRSDGKFVRDFLYVQDAADAYLCLAENLSLNPALAGEAFNFSLEMKITVRELVQTVLELMGRPDLEPVIQNTASSEIREQYMVCDKAKTMLGWFPHHSFEEGLRETIDWYSGFLQADPPALPLVSAAGL